MDILKWWKDKQAVIFLSVIILVVVASALCACFIPWGWTLSIVFALAGRFFIKFCLHKFLNSEEPPVDNTDSTDSN